MLLKWKWGLVGHPDKPPMYDTGDYRIRQLASHESRGRASDKYLVEFRGEPLDGKYPTLRDAKAAAQRHHGWAAGEHEQV